MPFRAFRSRLEQKLQATADAARRDIPAANIRDQLPPRALGPRGDTGQGYTPDPDAVTRIDVRKNSAGTVFSRRRLNLIEGSGATLTVADDGANEEIDITISAAGGGGSALTVEEADGTPTDSAVTKLIFPNGTLAIVAHEATYTPAAGGSDTVTTGTSAAVIPGLAGSADIAGAAGAGTAEEFDTTTDPFTWSPSNPATHASHTTFKSHLYILTTDSVERLGTKAWAPGGDFDVRMKVAMGSDSTPNYTVGIHIGSSGNTTRLLTQLQSAANGTFTISHFTYSGGSYTQIGTATPLSGANEVYLRITRTGTTIGYYYSSNGLVWQLWTSATFSITVANLGLRLFSASAVNCYAALDWMRSDV